MIEGVTLPELVKNLDLMNIYPLRLSGSRHSGEEVTEFEFVVHPLWKLDQGRADYRFDVRCEPRSASGEKVAVVEYSVLCVFEASDAAALAATSVEVLSEFGSSVAIYAAYPYLREGVQSVAARLGMPGVALGLLRRGQDLPSGMSFGELTDRESGSTAASNH